MKKKIDINNIRVYSFNSLYFSGIITTNTDMNINKKSVISSKK